MRPVVEGRPVPQKQQPGALAERSRQVRGRVAGGDQQVTRLQDRQHLLQVVEVIHLVEVLQRHARGLLNRAAFGCRVPVLRVHEMHARPLQERRELDERRVLVRPQGNLSALALPRQGHLQSRPQLIEPAPIVRHPLGPRVEQRARLAHEVLPQAPEQPRQRSRQQHAARQQQVHVRRFFQRDEALPRKRPFIGLEQPGIHFVDERHGSPDQLRYQRGHQQLVADALLGPDADLAHPRLRRTLPARQPFIRDQCSRALPDAGADIGALEPPLVPRPSLPEIAAEQPRQPQVVLGVVESGLDLERARVLSDRLVPEVPPRQRVADIETGGGAGGIQLDRPLVQRLRLLVPALVQSRVPQIDVGIRTVRMGREQLLVKRGGFVGFLPRPQHASQVARGLIVPRLELERPAVARGRRVEPLLLLVQDAQVVMGIGVVRSGGDRGLECRLGFIEPAHAPQLRAEIEKHARVIRLERQRLAKAGERLFRLALGRQRVAEIEVQPGIAGVDSGRAAKRRRGFLVPALTRQGQPEIEIPVGVVRHPG